MRKSAGTGIEIFSIFPDNDKIYMFRFLIFQGRLYSLIALPASG